MGSAISSSNTDSKGDRMNESRPLSLRVDVDSGLLVAQSNLSQVCTRLESANSLAKHLPQYKEIAAMVSRIPGLIRELHKEKL